ncbi:hypothetical protein GCK72_003781 [Caenorhabditis remanei]|uniref:F-box domain-containing protein n=1 Tax=Caenorhabditis remanei TaxID=31234 RepID=A0A6A5H9H9_CAERE|nr:hypothetical protein GCK72_003781 [Caenorhabditis remanei]KAF1763835.1 hypothetical protein GCK72_003781 [Caenorhabditis remanei]
MLSTLALKYCHQILFDPKFLIRKEFKFKKLPIIVRMLIIQLMDPAERFALSLTSKRMKADVKLIKKQYYYPEIVFHESDSFITLWGVTGFEICCNEQGYKYKGEGGYYWLQYKKRTPILNTALAIIRLSHVINIKGVGIQLTKVTPSLVILEKIFSNNTFKTAWNKITLDGCVFNAEIVTFFLNMADRRKEFQIFNSDMPLDFKHENVFKFRTNDYDDARWVTLSDMLNIRGVENVTLGKTKLTSEEVRHFIDIWINCPDDMFLWMKIRAMEIIQLEGLFNELVVLEVDENPPNSGYFTLAKSTSRAHKLLFIDYTLNAVVLSAWKPYDNAVRYGNIEEKFKNVYEIMELLEKKKTLEKEFEETRDVTKQREYRDQIQKLERKIHKLGVVYRDGRATI